MKLVKLKDKESLGQDFEFAGHYMYRLYKPDEDNMCIYMPLSVAEDTREYLEALLWTGISNNQEIKIFEGIDYVLEEEPEKYKIKIPHISDAIYVVSDRLKEAMSDVDMIMFSDGVILYNSNLPEWALPNIDYKFEPEPSSLKIYTKRVDSYILSETLYQAVKNQDVIFNFPSKIITTATELRELREGRDYVFEYPEEGAFSKLILMEKPYYVISERLRQYFSDKIDYITDGNGLEYLASTEFPEWAVLNSDYTASKVEGAMEIWTEKRDVYIISEIMFKAFQGETIIFHIPSHIEWNVEMDPEEIILNYEGSYKFPIFYEDEYITEKIQSVEVLEKVNDTLDAIGEWSVEDFSYPLVLLAQLIQAFSSQTADNNRVINWMINNKYDEVSQVLTDTDSASQASKGSCGCGSSSSFDLGITCSALEKYTNYMNNLAAESFGNINFLHQCFFIEVEGKQIPNEDLISRICDYLQLLKNGAVSVLNSSNPFCCPEAVVNNSLGTTIDNFCSALRYLGTDAECSKKQFITFWSKKFIEEIIK